MRVLLLDTTAYQPTTPFFLNGLHDLAKRGPSAYQIDFVDEASFSSTRNSIVSRGVRRIFNFPPLDRAGLNRALLDRALVFKPSVLLICKGAYVLPETLFRIKRETGALLVNYATDDPFNLRASTNELVASIALYDLYACTKRAIMDDVLSAGCKNVAYIPFAYKPEVHFPEPPAYQREVERFGCDVAFVGGCDSERIPFFAELLRRTPRLNLKLYGGYWNRHPSLRPFWQGFALGRDYRMALGGAKIALNLVRRANRDGHVMRTFEIPACGAFMLAERTQEHLELFREGESAAYFGSPEELASQVSYYLAHDEEREAIARKGHVKVTRGSHSYLDRLLALLDAVGSLQSARSETEGVVNERAPFRIRISQPLQR
jgi:spore maturation protein CgeB